jgi:hypothetical protein
LLLIAAIALTPKRLPVLPTTGVCPTGAQVTPTGASERRPVWSSHKMTAPARLARLTIAG